MQTPAARLLRLAGLHSFAETSIDDEGVHLTGRRDVALDVSVDGERVWSFNPRRDTQRSGAGRWTASWPTPLTRFLDGVGQITVTEHVGSAVLFDGEVQLGTSPKRLRIRDRAGRPLSVDKTGHLGRSFAERDPERTRALVLAARAALDFLIDEWGIDAFLAFGGLLGAVRDGRLIGHDVDLDLGYLSRFSAPVDVIGESFRLERRFIKAGWRTWRFSADDFKVQAVGVTGASRWIDIFGGFVFDGVFYLMPNVAAPADEVRLVPLGEVELDGQRLPAPADPAALLAATYGPTWRVPDPAFQFEVPRATSVRMGGWMRSAVAHRTHWLQFWGGSRCMTVPATGSAFAHWVQSREPAGSHIVDIGCGNGRDTFFFASHGHHARGYDYANNVVHRAQMYAKKHAAKVDVAPQYELFNLYDLRQALALGGELSREPEQVAVYARFVLQAVTDAGRRNLLQLARMALRRGGSLYLEFRVDADPDATYTFGAHYRHRLDPDAVADEIVAMGGHVEYREQGRGLAVLGDEDPLICRMVVSFKRSTHREVAP